MIFDFDGDKKTQKDMSYEDPYFDNDKVIPAFICLRRRSVSILEQIYNK